MLSSGGIDSTIVDVRMIIKNALLINATRLIMFHNHPSGDPRPGNADIKETERMSKACAIMGLSLMDHIIVSKDCFFSFSDESVFRFNDGIGSR